jgi:two-component system, chemotaxis family, sensor kinase CheA
MSDMSDDLKEIIDNFLVETNELIESLASDFTKLESDKENIDLIHSIFRTVHSIKGTAGFLGFTKMQKVSHGMEDLLNKLRHEEIKLNEKMMDVFILGLIHCNRSLWMLVMAIQKRWKSMMLSRS